jgi:hypothetical protein
MNVTVKPASTSAIRAADDSALWSASASRSDITSPTASAAVAASAVIRLKRMMGLLPLKGSESFVMGSSLYLSA